MGYILNPYKFDYQAPLREIDLLDFCINAPKAALKKKGVTDCTWTRYLQKLNQIVNEYVDVLARAYSTKQEPNIKFRRITSSERNSFCTLFADKYPLVQEKYYEFHQKASEGIDLGGTKIKVSTFKTSFEVCIL